MPSEQIARNLFKNELSKESIQDRVARRVSEYPFADRVTKEEWQRDWFAPTLQRIKILAVSWEEIVEFIHTKDPAFGSELSAFYSECIRFNRVQEPDLTASPLTV